MDELGNRPLVAAEHLAGVFLVKIAAKMAHGLACKIVEQLGVIVVRYVVVVHKPADDVVFHAGLFDAALAQRTQLLLLRSQELNPEFLRRRLVVQRAKIEREGVETRADLAGRHHKDAGDIDRLCDHHGGRSA